MRFWRAIYPCIAVCVFFACMTTGPSTEEGNPQIVAMIVDSGNRPMADVAVIAYLIPVNTDTAAQPGSAIGVASSRTDVKGTCAFYNLPPGSYSLVAVDSAGNRGAIRSDIVLPGAVTTEDGYSYTLELAATGSVRGTVTRNGVLGNTVNSGLRDAFIQIKIGEIDRAYTTGPDGAYSFSNLPPGSYTLYFYAADGFFCAKREITVTAAGFRETVVDTVILTPVARLVPPKEFHAVYDTSAGVIALSWQRVLYDSLRWYELERIDLAGPRDTVVTCTDTLYFDTLAQFPTGTVLDYVVRSVDKAFNRSANAGPVEIIVTQ